MKFLFIDLCEGDPTLTGRSFVAAYLEGDGGQGWERSELDRDEVSTKTKLFCASWWRLVSQDEEQFNIRQRIQADKPYNIDSIEDPRKLHLDHERYAHWPARPHRPYHMVEAAADGSQVFHTAKDCVSCYFAEIDGISTCRFQEIYLYAMMKPIPRAC